MKFNVEIYFKQQYLTTVYNVEADTEGEAIDLVTEDLEIDFEVQPHE